MTALRQRCASRSLHDPCMVLAMKSLITRKRFDIAETALWALHGSGLEVDCVHDGCQATCVRSDGQRRS